MVKKIGYAGFLFIAFTLCTRELSPPEWNNPFDVQGTNFSLPRTEAIRDTSIAIYDTLVVEIRATDSLGTVTKYLWSTDGKKFDTTTSSSRSFVWFSETDVIKTVWFKVVDNRGRVSDVKKFNVEVNDFQPVIEAPNSFIVRWDQEAFLNVDAIDPNGTIEKYIWKTSADPQWDTTDDPVWKLRHSEGGKVKVTIGAIDNDGCIGYANTSVLFNRRPETISIAYPSLDGIRYVFDEIDFTDTVGTIYAYGLKATDPDGIDDSLRYVVDIVDTFAQKTRRIDNVADSFKIDSLFPDRCYLVSYKAFDCFGDSVEKQIRLLSQNFFPKGMVYFSRDMKHGVEHSFWIDTTEVTQEEYAEEMGIAIDSGSLRLPKLISASPSDFLNKLNKKYNFNQGVGFRIPTRYEWLRAYKNPDNKATYYWGFETHQDVVKKYAWYDRNARETMWTIPHAAKSGIQAVAQLLPNEYGLYDMAGNVAEFVYSEEVMGGDAFCSIEDLNPQIQNFRFFSVAFSGFRKIFSQIIY